MEPENVPGQHLLGFHAGIKQFNAGKYGMKIYMYMDREWEKGKEKRFLNFIANPLEATANIIK